MSDSNDSPVVDRAESADGDSEGVPVWQNTAVLVVGALAAATTCVALLSMLTNGQRGMTVVRM